MGTRIHFHFFSASHFKDSTYLFNNIRLLLSFIYCLFVCFNWCSFILLIISFEILNFKITVGKCSQITFWKKLYFFFFCRLVKCFHFRGQLNVRLTTHPWEKRQRGTDDWTPVGLSFICLNSIMRGHIFCLLKVSIENVHLWLRFRKLWTFIQGKKMGQHANEFNINILHNTWIHTLQQTVAKSFTQNTAEEKERQKNV